MLRSILLLTAASGLSACGPAQAASADPGNDLHCSALASYLDDVADRIGSPPDQKRALHAISRWYAARLRKQGFAPAHVSALGDEIAPILEAMKQDPASLKPAIMTCTDRAVGDPNFEDFARRLDVEERRSGR